MIQGVRVDPPAARAAAADLVEVGHRWRQLREREAVAVAADRPAWREPATAEFDARYGDAQERLLARWEQVAAELVALGDAAARAAETAARADDSGALRLRRGLPQVREEP
ncbi:hypothetical protein GCM10010124_05040 [Pilimelia terevasa]|uniref:Uncharacterized protein n=1 Tax=Pilimelia terevasa TaxID=53372 RepID=A0A8J3FET4_9ACTN|nr:hypothetical protein [Pilimelia terevasa]GGK15347.1 hypothetical protein GCM10010124_05040 [Pilimelia terevasa]